MVSDSKDGYDVVVVGSIVHDFTSYTPRFPNPGEAVRGHSFSYACGGKGANQAVMASRLGAKVAMIGKVGNDMFGKAQLENFADNGVNAEQVTTTDEAKTSTASITVDDSGQNSIAVVLGANNHLTAEDIRRAESKISKAKVVVCQLEVTEEASLEALKLAKKHGLTTIFNPAPDPPNGISNEEFFKHADILCPNEHEAECIGGFAVKTEEDIDRMLARLLDRGAKTAIITLGGRGVAFATSENKKPGRVQVPKVKAVDVTGAGDAFLGALAYFTACHPKLSVEDRIRRACQIAAISVQSAGTQQSYPKRDQIPKEILE